MGVGVPAAAGGQQQDSNFSLSHRKSFWARETTHCDGVDCPPPTPPPWVGGMSVSSGPLTSGSFIVRLAPSVLLYWAPGKMGGGSVPLHVCVCLCTHTLPLAHLTIEQKPTSQAQGPACKIRILENAQGLLRPH